MKSCSTILKELCQCTDAQSSTSSGNSVAGSGSLTELISPLKFEEMVVDKEVDHFIRQFNKYIITYAELPKYLETKDMILDILIFAAMEYAGVLTKDHFVHLARKLDKPDHWGWVHYNTYHTMKAKRLKTEWQ